MGLRFCSGQFEKGFDFRFNFFQGFCARLKSFCPRAPRMQNIPRRLLLSVPPRTWIVVSKSIDKDIPKRLKPLNQQRFSKGNPHVVHNKITTMKIAANEIYGLMDRIAMLRKAFKQSVSGGSFKIHSAFPPAGGNRLANIDWRRLLGSRIAIDQSPIYWQWAIVVDCINTGS